MDIQRRLCDLSVEEDMENYRRFQTCINYDSTCDLPSAICVDCNKYYDEELSK